jgi:hypothetical protein
MIKLDSSLFDFLTWRAGSPLDLIGYRHCRSSDLIRFRNIIKEYAIGYCHAEYIPCRPKIDCIAIMFEVDGRNFWFHVTSGEFAKIFLN